MPTLYLKVSDETSTYLDKLAADAGTSKSQAAELIITAARDRGWTVTPGAPRITEPGPGRGSRSATGAGDGHSSTQEG